MVRVGLHKSMHSLHLLVSLVPVLAVSAADSLYSLLRISYKIENTVAAHIPARAENDIQANLSFSVFSPLFWYTLNDTYYVLTRATPNCLVGRLACAHCHDQKQQVDKRYDQLDI